MTLGLSPPLDICNMAGADVWKECLNWFRNCGINLPDNFPPTDNIDSFSRYLRDGVLLCHLVHLLKPNALDLPFDCLQPENNNEVTTKILI